MTFTYLSRPLSEHSFDWTAQSFLTIFNNSIIFVAFFCLSKFKSKVQPWYKSPIPLKTSVFCIVYNQRKHTIHTNISGRHLLNKWDNISKRPFLFTRILFYIWTLLPAVKTIRLNRTELNNQTCVNKNYVILVLQSHEYVISVLLWHNALKIHSY